MKHYRTIFALLALVLLPAIAAGSTIQAIADATLPPQAVADHLADKNMAYWFVTLAVVSIGSWTWVFKWVLGQLDSQRVLNAEVQKQLIEYMRNDHAQM